MSRASGALLVAEQKRQAAAVSPTDQQSRDVRIRRAAARALARIGGESARPGLLRALDDADLEVTAWGAYGLAASCSGHERETVAALAARQLALAALPLHSTGRAPEVDPLVAIARAVGRCGTDEAETSLGSWLVGDKSLAAASILGLGDVATHKQKLREESLAALLNLAAGSAAAPPIPEALYPIGRLERVPLTVVDRIREVASGRLAVPGEPRLFAIRALGRGGEAASLELGKVLGSPSMYSSVERVEAARSLSRLGRGGQKVLGAAVASLAPSTDPVALTTLVGDEFGVLRAVLDALVEPGNAKATIADLASLPAPPFAPPALVRRVSLLRCSAAKLLVGRDYRSHLLADCDVTRSSLGEGDAGRVADGSTGELAMIEVLGRDAITGMRRVAFREVVRGGSLRAREAAVALLAEHEEIDGASEILAEALTAGPPGLAVSASLVIAKQPRRAIDEDHTPRRSKHSRKKHQDSPGPAPASTPASSVAKALQSWLDRPEVLNQPDIIDPILDAVGALGLKDARTKLEGFCRSSYPTTRERAAKALLLVAGEKRSCEPPAAGGSLPIEQEHLVGGETTLTLDTDAGTVRLVLDPTEAPVTVTRIVDLARAKYFDGTTIQRVVPGFVTQFGAPFPDGFGGPEGRPALRCENSPLPFRARSVGLAVSGRDTGSSQVFITHTWSPHLDGQYPWLGRAEGPWDALVEGDVIHSITVSP